MESHKIEQLLDKYLNAETTLHEERVLQSYFTSDLVAPHLEEYRPLFTYFVESRKEQSTKTIQLKSNKTNWKWLSMAASVVLLFSVYNGYQYNQNQQIKKAQIAFEQTQEAFELLSKNLNRGASAVVYLNEYETTTNKIFK